MKKKLLSVALLLSAVLSLFSCGKERSPLYSASFLGPFDTASVLSGSADTKSDFEALASDFEALLWEYHRLYDIYTDYPGLNNLKTVNDMAGIAPVKVDSRILDLLEYASEIDGLTGGACRVTYGAVLKIWHEYRTEGTKKPPAALLGDAAAHTAPSLLVIDREAGTVYLTDPRASLDVGAIAKGYAVEAVCQEMKARGFSDFAANIGGNLRTVGKQNGKEDWVLGIRDPRSSSSLLSLVASDRALVTSGVYERYYTVAGEHLHHIIDPETNQPAAGWLSISVLADSSALADALSTALFTMTLDEGLALLSSLSGVEAVWVSDSGEVFRSAGIDALTAGGDGK